MRNRKPNRLQGFDYSREGAYFITICAREKENIFARINVGDALASSRIVGDALVPSHEVGNSQMPVQRVGALLACAQENAIKAPCDPDTEPENNITLSEIGSIIEKEWEALPSRFPTITLDEFVIMPNHIHAIILIVKGAQASSAPTLGQIVRAFKSKCAVFYLNYLRINGLDRPGKIWQRSFYDHVIRNEESLERIRKYIRDNPANWREDEYWQ